MFYYFAKYSLNVQVYPLGSVFISIWHTRSQAIPKVKERKKVIFYSCTDCVEFLESKGLASFIPQFVEAEVDGPLLVSHAWG